MRIELVRANLGAMDAMVASPHASPAELMDIRGRTVIVVGGATVGIGLGTARRLHEASASVVVADLDPAAGERAAEPMRGERHGAVALRRSMGWPLR